MANFEYINNHPYPMPIFPEELAKSSSPETICKHQWIELVAGVIILIILLILRFTLIMKKRRQTKVDDIPMIDNSV